MSLSKKLTTHQIRSLLYARSAHQLRIQQCKIKGNDDLIMQHVLHIDRIDAALIAQVPASFQNQIHNLCRQ